MIMKKIYTLLTIALFLSVSLQANAQTSSLWKVFGGILQPVLSTWNLKIPALSGLSCIGTDGSGNFQAGTCTGGGGSINTNPLSATYFVSTSTTATSTFAGGATFGGNVGIGTNSPNNLLTIQGTGGITGVGSFNNSSGGIVGGIGYDEVNDTVAILVADDFNKVGQTVHDSNGNTYITVLGADGNIWLDRNLGATAVATAYDDQNAYGSLFQWGRLADGHQLITWTSPTAGTPVNSTTATLSTTDNPGTSLFITMSTSPYDWRNPQNNSLWQGVSGTNNPCPTGFRLPTQTEWSNEITAAGITNSTTAYSSSLKLTVAGARAYNSGSLFSQGSKGFYWSSSVSGTNVSLISFLSSTIYPSDVNSRGYGFTVRCLADSSWTPTTNISLNNKAIAVKRSNGNVGIGTTTPVAKLHIVGNTEQLRLAYSSSVYNSLTVNSVGTLTISNTGGVANTSIFTVGNNTTDYLGRFYMGELANAYTTLDAGFAVTARPTAGVPAIVARSNAASNGNNAIALQDWQNSSGDSLIRITNAGKLGISTIAPLNKLDISGGQVIGSGYAGTYTAPSNGLLVQGNVGIGTTSPATALSVVGTTTTSGLNIPLYTPASSSATCTTGDWAHDASYIYTCTATNTWKRVALTTF